MIRDAVVVVLFLVVPGWLPARAVCRSSAFGLVLSPLATAVICSVAALGALLSRTSLLPWLVVTIVIAQAIGLTCGPVLHRSIPRLVKSRSEEVSFPVRLAALTCAIAAFPAVAVRRAPSDWDARSIWWMHSRWMLGGGAEHAKALANEAFNFAHQDYPPLTSASVAALWRLQGAVDLKQAQFVAAGLTLAAVAALGCALLLVIRRQDWMTAVAAGLLGLGAYGYGQLTGTSGSVDLLWSAAFASAAVLLLVAPDDRHLAAGILCLVAAGLTKNEGWASLVVLVGLFAVRRGLRTAWPRAAVALLVLVWPITVRALGAPSDIAESNGIDGLLSLEPAVTGRIGPTIEQLWRWIGPAAIVVGLVTVLGLVSLRGSRRVLGVGSAAWLWLAAAAVTALIGFTYVISPAGIEAHLRSSIDRTTVAPRLLLLTECAVWLVLAFDQWRRPEAAASVPAGWDAAD